MAAGPAVPLGPSVCISVHLWLNHFYVWPSASGIHKRSDAENLAAARSHLTAKRPAMLHARAGRGGHVSLAPHPQRREPQHPPQPPIGCTLRRHRVETDPASNFSDTGETVE